MQLPAFITSALGHFASTDAKLDAIAKAATETVELKARISTLENDLAAYGPKVAALTAERDVAKAKVTELEAAHAKEVSDLKAKIETEKQRATEVIAGQGLPLADLPPSGPAPHTSASDKQMNVTERCIAANRKKNLQ